jgi:23S rRNA pseudouridine1911/1915/1917 synthase
VERLAAHAVSRSRIQRWIALGAVRVDGALVLPSRRLRGFETIEVWPQPLESEQAFRAEPVPLDVIHADADVAVIAKPPGLVTHPAPGHWGGTLLNGLLHRFPGTHSLPRAGIVHRLDRDTSGLLVCALSERAFGALSRQLAARTMQRRYLAVVPTPPQASGSIVASIGRDPRDRLRMAAFTAGATGAKPARTDYQVLDERASVALIHCRLHTGRTHQIRVHLASIGCPLLGDSTYGGRTTGVAIGRQALHAWRLRFSHPSDGSRVGFTAPLPEDFRKLLDTLALALPTARLPDDDDPATAGAGSATDPRRSGSGRRRTGDSGNAGDGDEEDG